MKREPERHLPRQPAYRRPAVWVVLAVFGAFLAAQKLLVVRETPQPVAERSVDSQSPYLNTTSAAEYVGSQACLRCHADEHQSYLATTHSRSMSVVSPGEEQEPGGIVAHAPSHRRFEVVKSPEGMSHREFLETAGGAELLLADVAIKYRVGSGRVAHTYVAEDDGFLVESPVTWYATKQNWDMSPGFDKPKHSSFQRAVNQECLYCHTGRVSSINLSHERLTIHEMAIGCERCHGPGSLHVARYDASNPEAASPDFTIVNPKHLSRELGEAICQQCHLLGDARVTMKGQQLEDFRPGLRLEDVRLEFRKAGADSDDMTVVGHAEQLHRSRCYTASATLTCTTCHDPHGPVAKADREGHFNSKCLACHAAMDCGAPATERTSVADSCIHCHMPSVPTDVPHVAFTQHRIERPLKREPARPGPSNVLSPMESLDHLSEAERERAFGLAYWNLYAQHLSDPEYRPNLLKAFEHLSNAYHAGIDDAETVSALAAIALGTGDAGQAAELCRTALNGPDADAQRIELQAGLAITRFRQGLFAEARTLLKEVTAGRRDASDWYLLGVCCERLGNPAEAAEAFERGLAIDPSSAQMHRSCSNLSRQLDRPEAVERHLKMAEALESVAPEGE